MLTKRGRLLCLVCVAAGIHAPAQTWDTSGNNLLSGTYYFREVAYLPCFDQTGSNCYYGDLSDAVVIYGNITFDGNGKYTISGQLGPGTPQAFTTTGTYQIAASGLGMMSSPLGAISTNLATDTIYGLVSNGIFIGSSTENSTGYNDLLIAAPVSSPPATNATLSGTYWIAHMDFPDTSGDTTLARDAFFQLTADGQGHFGTITAKGYIGQLGASVVTQTISGATYSFQNGAANVSFGGSLSSSNLLAGAKILYISPDGNFVFGGSSNWIDFFVGVRPGSTTYSSSQFSGLYYQAGLDEDESQLSTNGFPSLDTFYGSFSSSGGVIIGDQRIFAPLLYGPYSYSYDDTYTVTANGTYDSPDGSTHYVVGAGGAVRIGSGIGPYLGLSVAFQAPTLSGSGVFLNPAGVVNAASSAPFTAGVARGELITLYGTNLAPDTMVNSAAPFSNQLDNVQVLINNRPAAIYYVSPTQLSALVPYETELTLAQIQVMNNGNASNTVTVFMNTTQPGVFTVPAGGVGYAAALHPDYSLVTSQSPAKPGETVAVFVTGLGDVSPANPDGAAGPANPLSQTTNTIQADINGNTATVGYAGLAPGLAGLYQVNITIPAGVSAGDASLNLSGPDSYTSEALIPIGTTSGPGAASAPHRSLRRPVPRLHVQGARRGRGLTPSFSGVLGNW